MSPSYQDSIPLLRCLKHLGIRSTRQVHVLNSYDLAPMVPHQLDCLRKDAFIRQKDKKTGPDASEDSVMLLPYGVHFFFFDD